MYDVIVVGSVYSLSFEVNSYYIRSEFVLHSKLPPQMSPNQPEFTFRPIFGLIRAHSGSVLLGYKFHFEATVEKTNNVKLALEIQNIQFKIQI